jgi:hypothetical protein
MAEAKQRVPENFNALYDPAARAARARRPSRHAPRTPLSPGLLIRYRPGGRLG